MGFTHRVATTDDLLYTAYGFVPIERLTDDRGGVAVPLVKMAKPIDWPPGSGSWTGRMDVRPHSCHRGTNHRLEGASHGTVATVDVVS